MVWGGYRHSDAAPFQSSPCSPYHGFCVCKAMLLGQVPQVDRELVQLVVPQVSVSQNAIEEAKG